MDIVAQDCRIEGFRQGGRATYWRATHLPTGVVVELDTDNKRTLMEELQKAVNEFDTSA